MFFLKEHLYREGMIGKRGSEGREERFVGWKMLVYEPALVTSAPPPIKNRRKVSNQLVSGPCFP